MSMKKASKKVPTRKCIGCQAMKDKNEMLRILKTSSNEIVLDITGKQNGRGAYLCLSNDCLEKATKNKGIERSLKGAVPSEVYDNLKKELKEIESK